MKYSDYVDYSKLDPFKKAVMSKMETTFKNIEGLGIRIVPESIGEPAALLDFVNYDFMLAFKTDGVGTKNKIADKLAFLRAQTAKGQDILKDKGWFYRGFGKDLIAMNVNDLICVGATPIALTDEVASGISEWYEKEHRVGELLEGLKEGCDEAGITIPCGETPTLQDIILPDSVNMTGASIGIVRPKERALFGQKLEAGDIIYGLASNGIHSNGLTLARRIAEKLPDNFLTELEGKTLGEGLLTPTKIYSKPVVEMFDAGIEIHYLSNITGSAWKKIMRARRPFTYVIENVPEPQSIFKFLQEKGNVSNEEAYKTWNMGVGFVIFAPQSEGDKIKQIANKYNVGCYVLGHVEEGEKQVVIKPLSITYKGE